MNEHVANTPLIVDTVPGVRAIVAAIEAEKAKAYVPPWPWVPLGLALQHLPLRVARKLMG